MKKLSFFIIVAAVAVGCNKDKLNDSSNARKGPAPSGPTEVDFPDEQGDAITAVEEFYSAYESYVNNNYDEQNSPNYFVGYGIGLLEATFNALHATEEEEYYATYEDEESFQVDAEIGSQDEAYVSEYDLLVLLDQLLDTHSDAEVAPVTDFWLKGDVGENAFTISMALSKYEEWNPAPIGPNDEHKVVVPEDCNGNPDRNASDRLSIANAAQFAFMWYYNVEKHFCHDQNKNLGHGGWDWDVYYWDVNSLGQRWPTIVDQSLTGYESLFLGGETFTNQGGTAYTSGDCVQNSDLDDFDNGIKTVLSDFGSYSGKTISSIEVEHASASGTPLVNHGLSFTITTGAVQVPAF